jgi:hypothetical protein
VCNDYGNHIPNGDRRKVTPGATLRAIFLIGWMTPPSYVPHRCIRQPDDGCGQLQTS